MLEKRYKIGGFMDREIEREIREIESIFKNEGKRINYCKEEINKCVKKIRFWNKKIAIKILFHIIIYLAFLLSLALMLNNFLIINTLIATLSGILFTIHTKHTIKPYVKLKQYEMNEAFIYEMCIERIYEDRE